MKSFYEEHTFLLFLGLAAFLAAATSLYIGLQQSVWFDEAYSIALAEHSWGEIVRLTAQDVHPPLYYWLLKAWMMVFGSTELALRSMSALLFGLSIGMAGLLLRRLFGARAALMTLPFMVFAPFLLRYGFEIRMYALASLIGVVATYVLVLAVESETRKRRLLLFVAYSLLVAAGVYTLYFMALLWIAHLVWLAWVACQEKRRDIAVLAAAAYAFAALLFIPWLPVFLSKAGGGTLSGVTHELGFENLLGIVSYLFLYQPPWNIKGVSVVIAFFIMAAIVYLATCGYRNATKRERRYLVLLGAYFIVPVLILVVVTRFVPIYLERYVAHIAIGAYAVIGVLAGLSLRSNTKWSWAVIGGLLSVLIYGCVSMMTQFGNYNFQRIHTPSVKHAAGLLTDCKNEAIIFADGPQIAMELGYYIKDCPIYFFNETLELGGGFAMISNSPLRVANASELPKASEVLHVYYNEPKNTLPASFHRESVTTKEKLSVAVYKTASR